MTVQDFERKVKELEELESLKQKTQDIKSHIKIESHINIENMKIVNQESDDKDDYGWDNQLFYVGYIHNKIKNILQIEKDIAQEIDCKKTELLNFYEVENSSEIENNIGKEGFVYIAKQKDKSYKIGITIDLEKRRKTFKIGNPFIEILASKKCINYKEIEKKIHYLLQDKKISGEWFDLNIDLLENIINDFNFNRHLEILDEVFKL
jgi:predicted GIY-YIG superfamily endonuclease